MGDVFAFFDSVLLPYQVNDLDQGMKQDALHIFAALSL
jgi:hypothetical protein